MRTCFQLLMVCLLLAGFASHVLACACCAEKGQYFNTMNVIDEYERGVLGDIKYSKLSALYIDEAGFETIKGLDALMKIYEASETGSELENIAVTSDFSGGAWTIKFASGGTAGSLTIPMPEKRGYFGADIHDGRMGGAGGPLLYKEIRLNGKVSKGTGLFEKGIAKGAEYSLIFQGRGNVCNNPEDFTHWRLSVDGPSAKYTFFGKLSSGNPDYFLDHKETADQNMPKFEEYEAGSSLASMIQIRFPPINGWAKRFAIHDLRFTIHYPRFTIHDSRFTIHDSRFTIYQIRPPSRSGC